jgi:large subunit ribosomal protein L35
MKTKKAVAARFKATGTGKLVRHKAGKRHILTKKSSKRKRALSCVEVVDEGHTKKYKQLMCVR